MDEKDMIPPKDIKPWSIKHGLYLDLEKYRIDGRSALGQAIARSRAALLAMFPKEADAAANILIGQIIYKSLRIELFQNWDMATGEAKPTAIQHYIILSNSLRNDLNTLMAMTQRQTLAPGDPDLKEYLETLKRAAKAQPVNVVEVERG